MQGKEVKDLSDRELDALVAEKVFGWEWVEDLPSRTGNRRGGKFLGSPGFSDRNPSMARTARCKHLAEWCYNDVENYSTDIGAAWKVVEKIQSTGLVFEISSLLNGGYNAGFYKEPYGDGKCVLGIKEAPRAICLAALKAVGA